MCPKCMTSGYGVVELMLTLFSSSAFEFSYGPRTKSSEVKGLLFWNKAIHLYRMAIPKGRKTKD